MSSLFNYYFYIFRGLASLNFATNFLLLSILITPEYALLKGENKTLSAIPLNGW